MDNIEKSEIMIARILSKALDFGLQRADLKFGELELDEIFQPFFVTSIDWLVAEGLIRVMQHNKAMDGTSHVSGITLTSFGFSVMGRKLNGADGEILVSEVVQKVSDSKASYSGFGDFVGGLLGGFAKTIST